HTQPPPLRCAVVGRGRMGRALSAALGLDAPLGRGADTSDADVVLLAVPDGEIAAAAAAVAPGRLVGHLSGATTLAPLAPHEAFSLHPLMTVSGAGDHQLLRGRAAGAAGASFAGATAAIARSSDRPPRLPRPLAAPPAVRPA